MADLGEHCLMEIETVLRLSAGFKTPLGFLALRNEVEDIAERYRKAFAIQAELDALSTTPEAIADLEARLYARIKSIADPAVRREYRRFVQAKLAELREGAPSEERQQEELLGYLQGS